MDANTRLFNAIINGDLNIIREIISTNKVIINTSRPPGHRPLHYAVYSKNIETVKLLLEFKADVNCATNNGTTPLHMAVSSRNTDIVKLLLSYNANKSAIDKNGLTPIKLAESLTDCPNDLLELLKNSNNNNEN